jgi:hypothetical protein
MSIDASGEINLMNTVAVARASKPWQIKDLALRVVKKVGPLHPPTKSCSDRVASVGMFFTQKGNEKLNAK